MSNTDCCISTALKEELKSEFKLDWHTLDSNGELV